MVNINLWNVYYMTTNAKADIWTQKDFLEGKIKKNRIGQKKYRATFPIQKLRTLNSGEKIFLICQINTSFNPKSINIPKSLKQNLPKIHGFILPINIRMASENEFTNFQNKNVYINKKERSKFYKIVWWKLNNDPWLSWRLKIIKKMLNGKYDSYNQKKIDNLLHYSQFNQSELRIKDNI